jgi:hypothetical protein
MDNYGSDILTFGLIDSLIEEKTVDVIDSAGMIDFSKNKIQLLVEKFRAVGMTEGYVSELLRINRSTAHRWYSGQAQIPPWAQYALREIWNDVSVFGPKGGCNVDKYKTRVSKVIRRKNGELFKKRRDTPKSLGRQLSLR